MAGNAGSIIFGWVLVAHQIGAAAAASMAGPIRTHQGSYDHPFMVPGSICVLTSIAVLTIGRRRRSKTLATA